MNRVYKVTPVSIYDVCGLERWLEDMALRGLALKKLRPVFSTFEKRPARPTRFRLEPFRHWREDEPPKDMLELYQDFGWTLAGETTQLLLFTTQDPDAPEPHSDPELQAQLWKKLFRAKRWSFLACVAASLILLSCVFYFLFVHNTPIQALLTTVAPYLLFCAFLFLIQLPSQWADVQRLALTVRQLELGLPLERREVYPRRRWQKVIQLLLSTGLLASIIMTNLILPFTGGGMRPLEEFSAFPVLLLEELEGKGYTPTSFVRNGQDYHHFYELRHYLLCPREWRVSQTGRAGTDGQVSLDIWRYDLPGWLSFLSVPLAQELLGQNTGINQYKFRLEHSGEVHTVEYRPRNDVDFLAAAGRGGPGFQTVTAASGDKVLLVRYAGSQDLAEHLEDIVEMLK